MDLLTVLLMVMAMTTTVYGGKVLLWCPAASKSMKITYMPVVEELARKGHEVTMVTSFPSKKQIDGVTEIIAVSDFDNITNGFASKALREDAGVIIPPFDKMFEAALAGTESVLDNPVMKNLLNDPSTKFDVVIAVYFLGHEASYYLADRFKASLVLYFTGQVSIPTISHAMGMPHNPALLPFPLLGYPLQMNIWQRTVNFVVMNIFQHFARNWWMLGKVDSVLDKYFPGQPRKPLLELEKNASLSFTFGHPLIADGLRPVAPNYVYLGMMNCRDPRPLPTHLQEFIEGAEHGVIFVSFGSVLKSSLMSESRRKVLISVFGKLKQRVIWKWETESMEDKPDNLLLSSWLPQQDILAHPNTLLFISHLGQSSAQETLCHQTPVVGIPINGDQPANANDLKRMGLAEILVWKDITEKSLHEVIEKVINTPSYRENANRFGGLLKDQMTKPLDRAVWHIEHLIRNPNIIEHMRAPVHDLAWYQYFMLDVLIFLLSMLVMLVFLVFKLLSLCSVWRSSSTRKNISSGKKKS